VERRLAAILSADAVGYSRLMAADEEGTARTLAACRHLISDLVGQCAGRVVDAPGDNVLAEFRSVVDAVRCAVQIQEQLASHNAALPAERRLLFRIGINLGDVLVEGERILGNGVNVAARLEGVAEPGGICISGTAYDQVKNKLALAYQDLGEQPVKNLSEPIRVYRVQLQSGPAKAAGGLAFGRSWRGLRALLAATAGVLLLLGAGLWAVWPRPLGLAIDLAGVGGPPVDPPLPDLPSLVILPFDNMSGDPGQEYFADGITEDLTTELSRNDALFVISRNTAFTYKGQAVKVEDVGRELGVRYVVEGSVRRDSDRIRVTAQLIDATRGFHLWGERYDSEIVDLFSVQSEMAEQIMGAVGIEIRAAEIERIRRKPTESLNAHDLQMRALHHYMKFTRTDHERARQLLERALELDPEYATAHAMLGGIFLNEYYNLWSLDPALLDRVVEQSDRALAIDEANPIALANRAAALVGLGRAAEARAYAERAVEEDPNWDVPHTILAYVRALTGDPLGALRSARRALRRNPKVSGGDLMAIADVNFLAGRTKVAQELYERIRAANPDLIPARLQLAVIYESQGRHEEAQLLVQESLRVNPHLTTDLLANEQLTAGFFDANEKAVVRDRLRRAGLP